VETLVFTYFKCLYILIFLNTRQKFGRGAYNPTAALGTTRPLHAPDSNQSHVWLVSQKSVNAFTTFDQKIPCDWLRNPKNI